VTEARGGPGLKTARQGRGRLLHAADVGLRVIDALGLVQPTGSTEAAITKLRAAVAASERA
jgi:hypothetical protein